MLALGIVLHQGTEAFLKLAAIGTWRRRWRLFYHGRYRHRQRKDGVRLEPNWILGIYLADVELGGLCLKLSVAMGVWAPCLTAACK